MVAPFFGPNIGEEQKKKKSSPQNQRVFGPIEDRDQIKLKKKGIHKLVELWFHIITWCHPKMVTPGAGRHPPSDATGKTLTLALTLTLILA